MHYSIQCACKYTHYTLYVNTGILVDMHVIMHVHVHVGKLSILKIVLVLIVLTKAIPPISEITTHWPSIIIILNILACMSNCIVLEFKYASTVFPSYFYALQACIYMYMYV